MNAKTYFEEYLPGSQRTVFHTKKGLSWRNAWGVLRYSANNAFIAFVHADQMKEQVSKWHLDCLWRSLLPHQLTHTMHELSLSSIGKGLLWHNVWGVLHISANNAFIVLRAR